MMVWMDGLLLGTLHVPRRHVPGVNHHPRPKWPFAEELIGRELVNAKHAQVTDRRYHLGIRAALICLPRPSRQIAVGVGNFRIN
jgi:hypothetical protein